MVMVQINSGELRVGSRLTWPVYDGNNRLLLQKGVTISSERQLESLLRRGIYRAPGKPAQPNPPRPLDDHASPFEHLDDLMQRIPGVFKALLEGRAGAGERVAQLTKTLRELYRRWPDAMLGAVHLCHEQNYVHCHPIHSALLAEMLACKLEYEDTRRDSLVAAALTQNIGMLQLQDHLQHQTVPLTDAQQAAVRQHPERAVQLLEAAGISDPTWLRAVLEHHEHPDGRGYPRGLQCTEIAEEAAIIALADRYTAMISARSYRQSMDAIAALKSFYLNRGDQTEERLTVLFIRELGIYPPGSFVKLNTGEVGVVVKRGKTALTPTVSAYQAPRGAPYPSPFRRDCATESYEIQQPYSLDPKLPMSLTALWSVCR